MEHFAHYKFIESNIDDPTFIFKSNGIKGTIIKVVQFTETEQKKYLNLSLGDYDATTGLIDYNIISNNGDTHIVLLTIAAIVENFISNNPNVTIYAAGSTKARTRLYQIGITKNIIMIEQGFEVLGLFENEWVDFKIGITYNAFLIKKK